MASRLVGAFLAVALVAVGVLAGLTLLASRNEVAGLVAKQNAQTAASVVAELGSAYSDNGGSWDGADLRTARTLAVAAGAALEVRDAGNAVVPGPGAGAGLGPGTMRGLRPDAGPLGTPRTYPVVVAGRTVGTAELRFPAEQPAPERQVRTALFRTVAWGSLLAGVVAVGVGVLVTLRFRRPVGRLTATARAMAAGDRTARTGLAREPAELGALARAFDAMADTIQREDELRRNLAADVAHELRTPVAIVQGELEALLDGVAEPTPERLSSLHDEALRLARLIDDLGTLSAADAAGLRLERRRIDLAEVAGGAVDALRQLADAAGVALVARLAPAPLDGDPARLEQVARNLIGNAVKFTPAGGTVTVSVAARRDGVELEVADTGPGIPPDELPHVFDRFWRGRSAAEISGSGVGLAVVAELVRAHGGTVSAASPEGGGARFTVLLPAA